MSELVIVISGGTGLEPSLYTIAASARVQCLGVIDISTGDSWALRVLGQCARRSVGKFGVRITAGCAASPADVEHLKRAVIDHFVDGTGAAVPGERQPLNRPCSRAFK